MHLVILNWTMYIRMLENFITFGVLKQATILVIHFYSGADVFIGGATPENNPADFDDLRNIVEIGETIGVVGSPPNT